MEITITKDITFALGGTNVRCFKEGEVCTLDKKNASRLIELEAAVEGVQDVIEEAPIEEVTAEVIEVAPAEDVAEEASVEAAPKKKKKSKKNK